MDVRINGITLVDICRGEGTPADVMLKSVYDTDNDGVVDRIKKITHIDELSTGIYTGAIPKLQSDGSASWEDDEGHDLDTVDGGLLT